MKTNITKELSRYYLNIIPNYIFYISYKHIFMIHFNSSMIKLFFFFLYKHFNSQFKMFIDLATVDFVTYRLRFTNIYNLLSLNYNSRIFCKTIICKKNSIDSITFLYSNSSWYERESWDLFGIFYHNHSDLRRILTDYGFKGFPLRKDFPLSGFIELKYDSVTKRISYKPISLIQEFRTFNIDSPWNYFT